MGGYFGVVDKDLGRSRELDTFLRAHFSKRDWGGDGDPRLGHRWEGGVSLCSSLVTQCSKHALLQAVLDGKASTVPS